MQYEFRARADNYEVPRGHLSGTLTTGQGYNGKTDILYFDNLPKDAHEAIYVLDFGTHVEVCYTSGWNTKSLKSIFIQPFPLNRETSPDGRPIDMSNWMLGPRRAFHLKLREV